jgi:hypothetical protein
MTVQTIKYRSITSNKMKNRQSFAPLPPPTHSLLLFPLSFFFRIIMTFWAEFRCYIGSLILAPWPTALAGLLSSWPTALGHNVVAHAAMFLTPWVTTLCLSHAKGPQLATPTAMGHSVMPLTPWTMAADV